MQAMTDEYETGYRFRRNRTSPEFEFVYPRGKAIERVSIGLEDVRAANDIEVRFDFDRDGWVIESPTKFMWSDGEDVTDTRLEEVAFIPAFSPAAEAELDRVNGTDHAATSTDSTTDSTASTARLTASTPR
jgi:hypothetical protein